MTINKLLIQDVGMCDVEPNMQLEAVVNSKTVLLEPTTYQDVYQVEKKLELCVNDKRHSLSVTQTKQLYRIDCGFCGYGMDLIESQNNQYELEHSFK